MISRSCSARVAQAVILCVTGLVGHSARGEESPVADEPFVQEFREPFLTGATPEQSNVRDIAQDGQRRIWIATAGGVFYREADRWIAPHAPELKGPSYTVAADETGNIWLGTWTGLHRVDVSHNPPRVRSFPEVGAPVSVVACGAGRVVVGTPDGYWKKSGERFVRFGGDIATGVQDVLPVGDDELWVATRTGLFQHAQGKTRRLHEFDDVLSSHVSALAEAPDGRIWIGSSGGIDVYAQGRRVARYTGREGLPCNRVTALQFDSAGTLWVGTALGLARFDGKHWTLRHSNRWLPHDLVRGLVIDSSGSAWVATPAGVGILRRRTLTLADKAAYFEQVVRQRHVRPPGLVRKCRLETPGDLNTFRPTDTDNDGLFSSLYLAVESYRYAATKDPTAQANAKAVFDGLKFLHDVTETKGFVARTVIPSDWSSMADRNRTYTPEQIADDRVDDPRFKRVENRWRESRDGRWLWKGDTSSDEISGHYFGYAVYYDLAAGEIERGRVREHVRKITDYIIDGAFTLRDIDGQPTLWGVWSPEKLNGDPNWFSERGCNSVEILSFLRVAQHMTGDSRYRDLAAELLDRHGYRENIKVPKLTSPGEFTFIDDQLLALGYRAIFAYSPNDADRAIYRSGIDQWHAAIREVHSPLYEFVYRIATGAPTDMPAAIAYLRDVPLDLINWPVDNTGRDDIELVSRPVQGRHNTSRLLPPSERGVIQWDGNPYQASEGGGASEECEPHFWLLPYWMGRYHQLIAPPASSTVGD